MVNTPKRFTIRDVANEANVSRQTVSRVINNYPDVASETRERVNQVIKRLGYQPDPIARSMRGITYTLGCITPNLSDFNFSSIVEAAQTEARKNGWFILTGSAQYENDVQPLLNEMMIRRVDGLIVINPRDDGRYKYLLPLIEQSIPIVYIKNTPRDEKVSAVCLDDKTGGYLAAKHLLDLGHTAIATILGPKNEECTGDRLEGYLQAYKEAGLTPDPRLTKQGNWSAISGSRAVEQLLTEKVPFTAVFAQNDQMAVGAISHLHGIGMRVPRDISVIGYDDIPLSSFFDPPLTTVRQPMDRFGRISAQLLIEAVKEQKYQPQVVRLDPELIVRKSCDIFHS